MIFGFGSRLRSHRVASDNSMTMTTYVGKCNDLVQSCWAKMPNELLREILIKVETSESTWPSRRNVVACAGVCKNWREIVIDVVKRPELSGKLTFPISLKQPGPRGSPIHCLIRRNRSTQTFHLYLNSTLALEDEGKFLLAAYKVRRPTSSHYFIAMHPHDCSKGYIGKLRSNFLATKFIVNDALPPHAGTKLMKSRSSKIFGSKQVSAMVKSGSYRVAQVSYELNSLGSRGPRKMQCIMDAIPASAVATGGVAPTQTEFPLCKYNSFPLLPFLRSNSVRNHPTQEQHVALAMWNKSPRWHEQLQCWCLNFHGRVTIASVKNFQLVAAPRDDIAATGPENVILQFGKVGKDVFTMDYSYPLSAFQAFAICLSSFDTKIACN